MRDRFVARHEKKLILRFLFSIAVITFLSFTLPGCVGKSGESTRAFPLVDEDVQAQTLVPEPGKSLVYFYHGNYSMVWKHDIELDGASSPIQKNSYLVWEVDPGQHTFQVAFHKFATTSRFRSEMKTEPDRIYYYHLILKKELQATSISYDAFTYSFQKVREKTGREKIKNFSLMAWFRDGDIVFQRALEPTQGTAQPAPKAKPEQTESPSSIQGTYHALVIGISEYEHLERLPSAEHDARAVVKALQAYGFRIKLLADKRATREHILEALDEYQHTLHHEDRLLIYYAGHSQVGSDHQMIYWQPVEAKADSMTQWIVADTITAALKRIPAVHILVAADSSYSGTFPQSPHGEVQEKAARRRYVQKIADRRARVILTSGADRPSPSDSEAGLSLFATAFVEGLEEFSKNEETSFTAGELFQNYILAIVAGQSERYPEFQAIRNSGHAGGDFLFAKE